MLNIEKEFTCENRIHLLIYSHQQIYNETWQRLIKQRQKEEVRN